MTASRESTAPNDTRRDADRVIGARGSGTDGPLLLVVAGLHGNEMSGVRAAQRVFARIDAESMALRGRFAALAGNLTAQSRGRRFVEMDLNRMWSPADVRALLERDATNDRVEEREQRELIAAIDAHVASHAGAVIILDLHSTSADAPPFSIISDTLQNRRIAFALSVPVILGLEEVIRGTIQDYYGECGYVTAAIEGGQHDDPSTIDRVESALWITLVRSGVLAAGLAPDLERHRRRLRDASRGLPSVVEVIHRHGRAESDGFRMLDGFMNFSPIRRGQLVAHDVSGDIRAPVGGMLVLPSYQLSGDDGYFVGRRVKRIWLRVSTLARRLRLDRLAPWLPGVRRHRVDRDVMIADPRITRWLVPNIFHLLGFRRLPPQDGFLVFQRRPEASPGIRRR